MPKQRNWKTLLKRIEWLRERRLEWIVLYTLHGRKLRFFKELETQRQESVQVRLVSDLRLKQTL